MINETADQRRRAMLRTAMGPVIAHALADPDVIEVMANPDGSLWIDRLGNPLKAALQPYTLDGPFGRLLDAAEDRLAFLIAPARALIVYDPSNYSQNVLTAARALEQINNQILSLQNQAVMLQNMAQNLQSLDYSSLGQMTGALTRIDALMTQADGLSYNLTQLESQWETQYPDSYAASVSTNDTAAAAQQRWQNAMSAYRQTMQVQAQNHCVNHHYCELLSWFLVYK